MNVDEINQIFMKSNVTENLLSFIPESICPFRMTKTSVIMNDRHVQISIERPKLGRFSCPSLTVLMHQST